MQKLDEKRNPHLELNPTIMLNENPLKTTSFKIWKPATDLGATVESALHKRASSMEES